MAKFPCGFPCKKSFASQKALRIHRSLSLGCKRLLEDKANSFKFPLSATYANPTTQGILMNSNEEVLGEPNHGVPVNNEEMDWSHYDSVETESPDPSAFVPETLSIEQDPTPLLFPPPKIHKRVTFALPASDENTPSQSLEENVDESIISPPLARQSSHDSLPSMVADNTSDDDGSDDSSYASFVSQAEEPGSSDDEGPNVDDDATTNDAYNLNQDSLEDSSFASVEDTFEDAGFIFEKTMPPFVQLLVDQQRVGKGNLHYPFAGPQEWSVASWLNDTHLPSTQIDKFLKLPYIMHRPPSFKSGAALHDRMEQLPDPLSRWMSCTIELESGTSKRPVMLFYRNPLEIVESLLQKPSLLGHMEFAPRRSWADGARTVRRYNEMSTGNWWWRTQESLPNKSTLIPIILGSDKAHLTLLSGNKKGWPVYLSIGNINSRIRNKPTNGAWVTLGHIPIVDFEGDSKLHSTLQNRLFHQCMRIILQPLVNAGYSGVKMADADGNIRKCFPRLAAYIADYPEQILVNVAAANNSPTSIAGYEELDDPDPLPPRTRQWILSQIQEVSEQVDPEDVEAYTEVAKGYGLSGVHVPFWVDLDYYEPENAMTPDILHGCLRFWRDHTLKWMQKLAGKEELDKRLQVLQPVVGYRQFKSGIKATHQWTGRDDRELLRVALAVSAGAPGMTEQVVLSLRALHDFIYFAQYRSHSDETLRYLDVSLHNFHASKEIFITTGARHHKRREVNGFKIPKLCALGQYSRQITELGSCPQFSTDITERCHQPMLKQAYRATNRREFESQMCRYLDRQERMAKFQEFLCWAANWPHHSTNLHQPPSTLSVRASSGVQATHSGSSPRRIRNRVTLLNTPDSNSKSIKSVAKTYHLPDLAAAIADYLELEENPNLFRASERHATSSSKISGCKVDVWKQLRLHLKTVQDEDEEAPSRAVQAMPPSQTLPYGRCDFVLIHEGNGAQGVGVQGYRVAQVRLIFRLNFADKHNPLHRRPLIYVQWLSRFKPQPESPIRMYVVNRLEGEPLRPSNVLSVDSIHRFIQLIPKFGYECADELAENNSADICAQYYVNSFADKEIFQSVY